MNLNSISFEIQKKKTFLFEINTINKEYQFIYDIDNLDDTYYYIRFLWYSLRYGELNDLKVETVNGNSEYVDLLNRNIDKIIDIAKSLLSPSL